MQCDRQNGSEARDQIQTSSPAIRPGLSSSDFHVSGPMKEALRGRRFSSDEEGTGAVKNWLTMQRKSLFLSDAIKKLVKGWNRALKSRGITLTGDMSLFSV
jgi:hypothetical protein